MESPSFVKGKPRVRRGVYQTSDGTAFNNSISRNNNDNKFSLGYYAGDLGKSEREPILSATKSNSRTIISAIAKRDRWKKLNLTTIIYTSRRIPRIMKSIDFTYNMYHNGSARR